LRARSSPRAEISGRNFGDGVLRALRARPEVRGTEISNGRLRLDLADDADMAALVSLIVGHGGLVEEVRREKASLEDVFLTLMEEEQ
jgi:ABC-2 type transport system ATP-binding protein